MAEREFPSNNLGADQPTPGALPGPPEREKKVEKIEGLGTVEVRKPSLGMRFKRTFFNGDAKGSAQYVWQNVLVPMAKNAFLDAIQQGSERMVWGEVRSRSSMGSTLPNLLGLGHQAYNKMYSGPIQQSGPMAAQQQLQVQQARQARATHNFSEHVVGNRAGAELIVDRMFDLLSRDGSVTVADYIDMLGGEVDYTMQKWGWLDLRGAQVVRTPQGWLIDLPRPIPLD